MYSTQRIDHLGLISGLIDEIGVVEYIDSIIPKTSNNTNFFQLPIDLYSKTIAPAINF